MTLQLSPKSFSAGSSAFYKIFTYKMLTLGGIWLLVFAILIILKPEIIAFLFAGFLFFLGIASITFALYLRK